MMVKHMSHNEFSDNYLSHKWTISILFDLLDSTQRPSTILKTKKGISKKIFYESIFPMINDGFVEKKVVKVFPSHVEYRFTDKGESMFPFLNELRELKINPEILSHVFKCKWLKSILLSLLGKTLRAMELKETIGDVSNKVLSEKLKKLEKFQVVERTLKAEVPVRVEYKVNDSGKRLAEFLAKYFNNTTVMNSIQ